MLCQLWHRRVCPEAVRPGFLPKKERMCVLGKLRNCICAHVVYQPHRQQGFRAVPWPAAVPVLVPVRVLFVNGLAKPTPGEWWLALLCLML